MNSNIINLNSDREYESSIVGGKGKSLIWMKRNGIDVPEGFVVSAFCFDKYYEKAKKEHGIPKELEEELFAAYDRIIGSGLVAVRSSATNEDQREASFAGQYDSVLYVDKKDIPAALIKVWFSLEACNSYCPAKKVDSPKMAVVIQKMIFPEYSGVAFTHYHYTNANSAGIEIVKGGLDKLVSGKVSPSRYVFNKEKGEYVHSGDVYPEIEKIYTWAMEIEKLHGYPCDIEWAVVKGRIYLLQARSITTQRKKKPVSDTFFGKKNAYDKWTKGNVSEVLPEEMTPLSWSVWGEILNELLRKSFRHLPEKYHVSQTCFIRLREGKLEYNIGAINYLTHTVMGFPSMNEVVGGNHIDDIENCDESRLYWGRIIRNLKAVKCNNAVFDELPALSEQKYSEISKKVTEWGRIECSTLSNEELYKLFRTILSFGIENMGLHTDATSASFSYVNLAKLFLQKWMGSGNLIIQLISDIDGIEIAEIGKDAYEIRKFIESKPEKEKILKILEGKDWRKQLAKEQEKKLLHKINNFIKKYGHRGTSELEFSVKNWGEDPRYLLDVLINTCRSGQKSTPYNDSKSDYKKAMRYVEKRLGHNKIKLSICKELIQKSREYTRLRENNKHHLYLVIAQLKRVLNEILERLPDMEKDFPKYKYYMKIDEIYGCLLNGEKIPQKKILQRYAEYQEYRFGNQMWKGKWKSRKLKGFPASFGIVKGRVKILNHPNEIKNIEQGNILVVKTMDIGWTPAFGKIGGLITEIGGTLSHAAIVAREYGVPAIVNVPFATQMLKNNSEIILNADTGVIKVLDGEKKHETILCKENKQ